MRWRPSPSLLRRGAAACFLLGLAWVALFPAATVSTGELKCRGTYFSENALLHGAAQAGASYAALQAVGRAEPDPAAFLRDHASLETHSFGDDSVYALLRASPGADGKEALVLAASPTGHGAAVAAALLDYLAGVQWLSKDVVLLLAPDPGAWLAAYHSSGADALEVHAGALRAALVLEVVEEEEDEEEGGQLAVLAAGENGQLPNLDLVNIASAMVKARLGQEPALDRCGHGDRFCDDWLAQLSRRRGDGPYWDALFGLFRFMLTLARGSSGSHGAFLRFDVDAVTIAAHGRPANTLGLLQALELTVRSLSTTEEKLHQSFWLYLLPAPGLFVSVGEYVYSLGLVFVPLVWFACRHPPRGADVLAAFGSVAAGALVLRAPPAVPVMAADALVAASLFGLASRSAPAGDSRRAVACLLAVYAHAVMGLLNYSLAMASAVVAVPLLLLAPPPVLAVAVALAARGLVELGELQHAAWLCAVVLPLGLLLSCPVLPSAPSPPRP